VPNNTPCFSSPCRLGICYAEDCFQGPILPDNSSCTIDSINGIFLSGRCQSGSCIDFAVAESTVYRTSTIKQVTSTSRLTTKATSTQSITRTTKKPNTATPSSGTFFITSIVRLEGIDYLVFDQASAENAFTATLTTALKQALARYNLADSLLKIIVLGYDNPNIKSRETSQTDLKFRVEVKSVHSTVFEKVSECLKGIFKISAFALALQASHISFLSIQSTVLLTEPESSMIRSVASDGNNMGVIVGVIVGMLVIAALVFGVLYVRKRRARSPFKQQAARVSTSSSTLIPLQVARIYIDDCTKRWI
jgi:hypothetical protein